MRTERKPFAASWRDRVCCVGKVATVTVALSVLVGCRGGGDGGEAAPPTVSISMDSTDTVVATSTKELGGRTECDGCPAPQVGFGYCPVIACPSSTNIRVQWSNQTTGSSGNAVQGISSACSCLFSYCTSSCRQLWSATIPVSMGQNLLHVSARDVASNGAGDTSVTVTRIPAAPTGMAAVAGKDWITLQWNSVAEAKSYDLYWSTSSPSSKTTGTKIANVSQPYTHAGLSADATYYYFVVAVHDTYESDGSTVVWATPGWQISTIAVTANNTQGKDTSIAIDSADNIHVHYAYDDHVGNTSSQYGYYLANLAGA